MSLPPSIGGGAEKILAAPKMAFQAAIGAAGASGTEREARRPLPDGAILGIHDDLPTLQEIDVAWRLLNGNYGKPRYGRGI